MNKISRRDFLKIAGGFLLGGLLSPRLMPAAASQGKKPNIIIILCDAFSARNMSLYGYPRRTTPLIESFAEHCTVYHQHLSGGNYTTTGTATLLTGMYAWKHRAFNQGGLVRPEYASISPHSLLDPSYYKLAFAQNPWSERLLAQNQRHLDKFLPHSAYSLAEDRALIDPLYSGDRALGSIAVKEFLFPLQGAVSGSFLFRSRYKYQSWLSVSRLEQTYQQYPDGLPTITAGGYMVPYLNEAVYDGIYEQIAQLAQQAQPYYAFFHLFSPHSPYHFKQAYSSWFRDDGFEPVAKPAHPLSKQYSLEYMLERRTAYDRVIAQVDEEFGRLMKKLDEIGVLNDSYIILTSDHGEMFERGFVSHGFQFMYEPVLHIPLLVHAPGQTTRTDVYLPTSSTDVLPSLLHATGANIPAVLDGQVLPGFGGDSDPNRPIFSIVAYENSAFGDIKKAVISLRQGAYKLIAYLGYEKMSQPFELYNIVNDAEELQNLVTSEPAVFKQLKDVLFTSLSQANLAASSRETFSPPA